MKIAASDVIPLSPARANLSELAEAVKGGAENLITKNGQLERERIHLLLIDEAGKGLGDVAAGKVNDVCSAIAALKRKRSA